jgi:hypothetical protein
MPLHGTIDEMRAMMRRHEADGLGTFSIDDSDVGRVFVETAMPGGERWKALCGCVVMLPRADDPALGPTFQPTDAHLDWAEPTDAERAFMARLDEKLVPRTRVGRWLGRRRSK